jgi:hypothetical protein
MFLRPGYVLHWLALLPVCVGLISCGGGGDGSSSPGSPTNQIAVVVDAGPAGANVINALYASVTLCVPGSTNCQTIDHVLVDTGASGVRILASKLEPGLLAALPPSTNGALQQPVAQCMQFVSGYSWGSVRTADIKLGGQTASSAMIQVIGDPAVPSVPSACSRTGPAFDTVQSLGANGIIGLSTFAQDCGHYCASIVSNGIYYACTGAACSPIAVPIENQLWNPVALFPANNNGIVVSLPSVPATGALEVKGTLTFGIGTQANNSLGSAIVLTVDSIFGEFG